MKENSIPSGLKTARAMRKALETESRVLDTTNHVAEDMLDLVTKDDLVEAVKYWSLKHSELFQSTQTFKDSITTHLLNLSSMLMEKATEVQKRRIKDQGSTDE